ncbi:unnamed protein product [Mucor hiemalis]
MSRNYLGDLKEKPQLDGTHHAFYAVPPAELVLNHDRSTAPSASIGGHSHKAVVATPTPIHSTNEPKIKIYTALMPPTHNVIHFNSISSIYSSGSSLPSSVPSNHNYKMSPPLVNNESDNSSFKKADQTNRNNSDEIPWLAPLLGVLGTLGLVGIIILYLIGRKKKKRNNRSDNSRVNQFMNNNNNGNAPEQQLSNSYQSWASLSTINMSAGNEEKQNAQTQEKTQHVPPPPAYTSVKQKRLTSDTLVDENSVSVMLKNQYSPQLAFSPSLIAGDFQQQRLEEVVEKPPLPTMSPSNTLIDNAGVINNPSKTENYHYSFDHRPKKIEMYDPQVNLQTDSNPFIPYSYSNDETEEKQSEDNLRLHDNNESGNHHVVDMNK